MNDGAFMLHNNMQSCSFGTEEAISYLNSHPRSISAALCSAADFNGDTPLLIWCALYTKRDLSHALLKKLLDLCPSSGGIPDRNGTYPLHKALRNAASLEAVELICQAYPAAILKTDGSSGETPLEIVILEKREEEARLRVLEFSCPAAFNSRESLLLFALQRNSPDHVITWLLNSLDPSILCSAKDKLGNLPLHAAIKKSSSPVVQLILRKNHRQASLEDSDGHLPLHLALTHSHDISLIQELMTLSPSSVRSRDMWGRFPLAIACCSNATVGIVEILLLAYPEAVGDKNVLQNDSMALHYAAARGTVDSSVVDSLLRLHPAAAATPDRLGDLALHQAAMNGAKSSIDVILSLLQAYPAAARTPRKSDKSLPLHLAAASGSPIEIVQVLLDAYLPATAVRNSNGKTPLQVALSCNPIPTEGTFEIALRLAIAYPHTVNLAGSRTLKEEEKAALSALMHAVRTSREVTPVHIHLCGDSHAGKTTIRNGLAHFLGRPVAMNAIAHRTSTTVRPLLNAVNAGFDMSYSKDTLRTVGMESESLDRINKAKHTRFILLDYGGQREFHVNHSRFLASTNSIYVVVVALWDEQQDRLVGEEEAGQRYAYWLKYLSSVATESPPTVLTVINFKAKAELRDRGIVDRTTAVLKRYEGAWGTSEIAFAPSHLVMDAITPQDIYARLNLAIYSAIDRMSLKSVRISPCIDVAIREKKSWPKAIPLQQLKDDILMPLLLKGGLVTGTLSLELVMNYMCKFMVNQLTLLGELVVIEDEQRADSEPEAWSITDPNWLTSTILGQIFKPSYMSDGASSQVSYYESMVTFEDIVERAGEDKDGLQWLPFLLQKMGATIPIASESSTKYWFPSFSSAVRGTSDCMPLPAANRRVHRRYHLSNSTKQIFPPGYFSNLFCAICGLERHSRTIRLYADGMEIVSNYSHTTSGLALKNKIQVIVICSSSSLSFDVVVCAGKNVVQGDGRVWTRLQQIRAFITGTQGPTPDRRWHHNVLVSEFCVNPSDNRCELPLKTVLQQISGAGGDADLREEMMAYLCGEHDGGAAEEDVAAMLVEEGLSGVVNRVVVAGSAIEHSLATRDAQIIASLSDVKEGSSATMRVLRELVLRKTDLPGLPLLLKTPPKTGLKRYLNFRNATHSKFRLHFVCPVTLQVARSGPKGKGYKVLEPKIWVKTVLPVLKISLVLICIGMKVAGIPLTIPMPDFCSFLPDPTDSGFFSQASHILAEAQNSDPISMADDAGGMGGTGAMIMPTGEGKDSPESRDAAMPLSSYAHELNLAASIDQRLTDEAYESLRRLLMACGDPMPLGRPLHSGLVGPLTADDGTVAWVLQGHEDEFRRRGKACFEYQIRK